MLEAVDLECARGDRSLFRGLSFTLRSGELLHVTGVNGSGKTTLLRALCGLTRLQAGEVRWNGAAIGRLGDEYHAQLGYIGHSNGIQGELSPEENLRYAAGLHGLSVLAVGPILERLGLSAYCGFPSKILSQGQKRRLALARLLLAPKPLWILDEPLSALDTQSVALMTDLWREHLNRGGMIVLTSHQELDLGAKTVLPIGSA